jgi:hypothetical protein
MSPSQRQVPTGPGWRVTGQLMPVSGSLGPQPRPRSLRAETSHARTQASRVRRSVSELFLSAACSIAAPQGLEVSVLSRTNVSVFFQVASRSLPCLQDSVADDKQHSARTPR